MLVIIYGAGEAPFSHTKQQPVRLGATSVGSASSQSMKETAAEAKPSAKCNKSKSLSDRRCFIGENVALTISEGPGGESSDGGRMCYQQPGEGFALRGPCCSCSDASRRYLWLQWHPSDWVCEQEEEALIRCSSSRCTSSTHSSLSPDQGVATWCTDSERCISLESLWLIWGSGRSPLAVCVCARAVSQSEGCRAHILLMSGKSNSLYKFITVKCKYIVEAFIKSFVKDNS